MYATGGCPVNTGKPCTKEMIHAAVERGPHGGVDMEEAATFKYFVEVYVNDFIPMAITTSQDQ